MDAEGQPLCRQLRNVDFATRVADTSHASEDPFSNCSTQLDYINHIFCQACECTDAVTTSDLIWLALLTPHSSGLLEAGWPQAGQYQVLTFQLVIQVGNMHITGCPRGTFCYLSPGTPYRIAFNDKTCIRHTQVPCSRFIHFVCMAGECKEHRYVTAIQAVNTCLPSLCHKLKQSSL